MAEDRGVYRDAPSHRSPIPAAVLSTSPVSSYGGPRELPLDLVQRIISYIDDVADIARITRTSRLLYYMATPGLYERVTLKAYSELRYINGMPEGYGGGSPFSMGLLGLATGNQAAYVKHWKVTGEWRERDVEELKKGRIPDNSMMLNISLRAAMDRMAHLESFCWDINGKPMPTIYHGLSLRPTLTQLRIKAPNQRISRPICVVPPIPSLRSLWLTDMDPLCFPDDFSNLLLGSKHLEELKLHWSPRMREEAEPSINVYAMFQRCVAAGYRLRIKDFAFMNLYASNHGEIDNAFHFESCERVSMINCTDMKNPKTVFFDKTWTSHAVARSLTRLKSWRGDSLNQRHAEMCSRFAHLEEFYVVKKTPPTAKGTPNGSSSETVSASRGGSGSPSSASSADDVNIAASYLAMLTQSHGHNLRIVLLSETWQLGAAAAVSFAKGCPNLEQLGFAPEDMNMTVMRAMMAYMPKVYVVRLLCANFDEVWEVLITHDKHKQTLPFSYECCKDVYKNLRWIGVGPTIYELGGLINEPSKDLATGEISPFRRSVKLAPSGKIKDFELWSMDVWDLV